VKDGSLEQVQNGEAMAVGDFSTLFGGSGGEAPEGGLGGERVGDVHGLRDLEGEIRYLEIGATLEAELDTLILGYLVGEETFDEFVGEQAVALLFILVEQGRADAVGLAL